MRFGLILLCAGLLPAQPAPDKCRLEGKVLNSATGAPVRKAQVVLSGMATAASQPVPGQAFPHPAQTRLAATTDGEGRFVFDALDAGKYTVMANRDGFQNQTTTLVWRAEPVLLAPGVDKRDLILKIEPLSVISGHVRDEDGDPVRRAQVSVMMYHYTANGRELATTNTMAANDLGEYRFFDLQPGKYYVRVTVYDATAMAAPGSDEDSYAPTFYPGAPDASTASVIELRPGQEQSGADFTLRRTHTATVSGHLAKPVGASQTNVRLAQVEPGLGMGTGGALVGAEDGFQIRQVLPGSYVLAADTSVGDKGYVARVPVQVAGTDIKDLVAPFVPTFDMNGRVQIEGAPSTGRAEPGAVPVLLGSPPGAQSRSPFSQVMVYLNGRFPPAMIRRTAGGITTFLSGTAKINDDGTIVFKDLAPDIYTASVSVPPALYLKSMRCGDAEIGDAGIDLTGGAGCELSVVLSYNGGRIEGSVEDENGQPAVSAVLTLVPMGSIRKFALFKTEGASQQGSFTIQGIAPGAYTLYAWEDVDANAVHYDPDFLRPYEALGQAVQISEGASEHVTVKLIKKPAEP
jgi:uncharacterized protein (DUF2141 family)